MPIRDTRMDATSIVRRWPMSDAARKATISRLLRVIADPESKPREIIAASKALLIAEAQNQADEHKVVDVKLALRNTDLDAIAADLGIEIGLVEDASRKAGIGIDGTEVDAFGEAEADD
jgi:hypothetical protein